MAEEKTLSGREKEILQLVARGMTNREIAQALVISPNTVKVHLSNIFEKIAVQSRTEATLYGIEHGLVEVPGGEQAGELSQSSWRQTARQNRWIWAALLLLVSLFLVTFSANVLFPAPTPDPAALGDIAERWQELAPLPEHRVNLAAVAYGEEIYAIGGKGIAGISGTVFRYNFDANAWDTLNKKPTPVVDAKAAVIGEKIYVPGGQLSDGYPTDIFEIYDPRRDEWMTGAPLPIALSAYALADFEGQLYLFGGWDGQQARNGVWVYNPVTDAWREGTSMPVARYDSGAVSLEDKIVVLGGRNESGALAGSEAYFPSRDFSGENPWGVFEDMEAGRYGFGAASIYDTIYVIGGEVAEKESASDKTAWLWTGADWVELPTNQDYSHQRITLVSVGSQLVVFDPSETPDATQIWAYQAFYYTIYIPFVP